MPASTRPQMLSTVARNWINLIRGRRRGREIILLYKDETFGDREYIWAATPSQRIALEMTAREHQLPGTEKWFTTVPWVTDGEDRPESLFVVAAGDLDTHFGRIAYSTRRAAEEHVMQSREDDLLVLEVPVTG